MWKAIPQVSDPDRSINDDHSDVPRAPAPDRAKRSLRATQLRQPPMTLLRNQGFKAPMDERGFFPEAGELSGLFHHFII